MIEDDLYSYFSTYAGLAALIGDRIHPDEAPQDVTKPYCTYSLEGNERQYSHQGHSGLVRTEFQIDCYAETPPGSRAVAAQIIAAIEAWGASNSKVQAAFVDGETGSLIYQDGVNLYVTEVLFYVYYG